ncbi:hypothetical protein PR001_g25971 [Phytophthora rubi]|uniref:Uncharacterized protein n=1 Tax=Phytophthora rubi TaxID=129364 RepID=A0A6A3I2X4_9STRA|nr:hypothetical protein PR001_g25971 [Phytophthora rubi]
MNPDATSSATSSGQPPVAAKLPAAAKPPAAFKLKQRSSSKQRSSPQQRPSPKQRPSSQQRPSPKQRPSPPQRSSPNQRPATQQRPSPSSGQFPAAAKPPTDSAGFWVHCKRTLKNLLVTCQRTAHGTRTMKTPTTILQRMRRRRSCPTRTPVMGYPWMEGSF